MKVYSQKSTNQLHFNALYPYRDIMCIMSSSEIVGRKSDTFEKTIEGILNKKSGIYSKEKVNDYLHARDYLCEKYPQLYKTAMNFREMINKINKNHFAISDAEVETLFNRIEKEHQFIELV